MADHYDRFHLYATATAQVVAIEDTADAIDRACGLNLVERLVKKPVGIDQAQLLIRNNTAGGQIIYGERQQAA